jgi:ribulose-5-phosphate 4-epimerase/fuculose-1-phosphate aldolase
MTENQAREAICRVGKSLFDRGYVHATAGNISVRLDDGFLITPTDACLGFLDPARLARTDAQGIQTSGDRASKTLALHRRIYAAACAFDPDTRSVIHTHSTHCVALTLQGGDEELLPALTPYFVMKVGHVPVMPYHRPGAEQAAEAVAQAITRYGQRGTPLRAVMLPRLGPNVWHGSPEAAMATLEELEETARLRVLQPTAAALSEADIESLRQTFGARW